MLLINQKTKLKMRSRQTIKKMNDFKEIPGKVRKLFKDKNWALLSEASTEEFDIFFPINSNEDMHELTLKVNYLLSSDTAINVQLMDNVCCRQTDNFLVSDLKKFLDVIIEVNQWLLDEPYAKVPPAFKSKEAWADRCDS